MLSINDGFLFALGQGLAELVWVAAIVVVLVFGFALYGLWDYLFGLGRERRKFEKRKREAR
jgi:uncharacterized protein (DUF2062 family)